MTVHRISTCLGKSLLGGILVLFMGGFHEGWGGEKGPPLVRDGSGFLTVERSSLLERIRRDLGLFPGARIVIGRLPRHIRGVTEKDATTMLIRQDRQGRNRYLYRLDIIEDGVTRESFYLNADVLGGAVSESPHPLLRKAKPEEESLEEGALVRTGDMVRVTVKGQGFQIGFSGISQGGGGVGDRVPVINPKSGRSLTGEVTGHDTVTVLIAGGDPS